MKGHVPLQLSRGFLIFFKAAKLFKLGKIVFMDIKTIFFHKSRSTMQIYIKKII